MYKGFSDFTVEVHACEQPCVAILFIFAFCGYALAAKKFCFQLYQFNAIENMVNIKAFGWPDCTRGLALGCSAVSNLFT